MPSARRLMTLGGAAFVGVATTALLIASPASAHTAALSLDHKCADDGSVKVIVTVTNDWDTAATLKHVETTPALKKIKDKATVDANGGVLKESVSVPAGTTVSVSYTATWADGHTDKHAASLDTGGLCPQPCPSSITPDGKGGHPKPTCPPTEGSPSPSPSTGGQGGGGGSPTPSASTPTLPKTGAQTSYIAGGAVVLLGAGTGLFFLARRRRVKFEA